MCSDDMQPVQALCLFGLTLCCELQVTVIEFQLNMYILIAAAEINGCFGGLTSILGVSFAAVSDVTPKKWWMLLMIMSIQGFCAVGIGQIINYYSHNKPLEWTYDFIGIYGLLIAPCCISHCYSTIFNGTAYSPEPILNPFIIVFAALVAIGTNAMMETVKTDWEMFVGFYVVQKV
uniref:Uncharacterized protein n=1 Tax=Amphimedon queenslandica TaxID=400682 RepID=A0A1X7VFH8_AMPQE